MSSAKCYTWDATTNKPALANSDFDQPCPSGGGCCNPGDTCVGNFMCKHKEKATDPNRPDYYISACTDSKYSSSACVKWCAQFIRTGVVYNATSDRWQCCGTVNPPNNLNTTCATPSNVSFALVSPEELPIIGIAGGGLASPSSKTSSAPAPTSTSVDKPSSSSSSSGISTGAQVGLGVGLGVAFTLVIAALIYVFLRRRRRSRARAGRPASEVSTVNKPSFFPYSRREKGGASATYVRTTPTELAAFDHRHVELSSNGTNTRVELPS